MQTDLAALHGFLDGLAVGGEGLGGGVKAAKSVGHLGVPADVLDVADQLRLNPGSIGHIFA